VSSITQLVVASANPDKVAEIAAVLTSVELVARPPDLPDVVEDGDTLEANARLKAVAVSRATGSAAVADDTGLFVAALEGAPGVHTARFAGPDATYADNVRLLLATLDGVIDRRASFRTCALVVVPGGAEIVAHGVVDGRISLRERGDGGFGYDPVFVPAEGDGRTFAEMDADEKNALSHRGRAFRALSELL
jgi:XTP/dITP diphosphohydrolase